MCLYDSSVFCLVKSIDALNPAFYAWVSEALTAPSDKIYTLTINATRHEATCSIVQYKKVLKLKFIFNADISVVAGSVYIY